MRKLLLTTLLATGLVFLPSLVSAQAQQQNQQQLQLSASPTGNQVQNRDMIQTQEQNNLENATGEGSQNRNQNAVQNMSEVAKQVQLLLQVQTTGGIGDQVREIARVQNQSQLQIQEHINKLDAKSKLARFLTGTDYSAVNNLKQQLTQNQLRIQQLEQIQTQLTNKSDITIIQSTIQAIVQENTSLQERITAEEQTKSLFGWLVRLFN